MPEETKPQTPTPAAPASDQYDLSDHHFDPEIDSVQVPRGASVPVEKPASAPPGPPRDEAGRFAKPKHSPRLLAQAAEFSIPQADIDTMEAAELTAEVQFLRQERLFNQRLASHNQPPSPAAEPPTPAPVDGRQQPGAGTAGAQSLGITEAEYDPKIVKMAQAVERILAAMPQIHAAVGNLHQFAQARAAETRDEKLDRAFAALGDDARLGKGAFGSLTADSAERSRRNLLVGEACRIAGDKASLEQVIASIPKAHERIYGGGAAPAAAPESASLSKQQEEWNEAGLARPTNRLKNIEPKGEARAQKAVAEKIKENGWTEDDFGGVEEAGLPE